MRTRPGRPPPEDPDDCYDTDLIGLVASTVERHRLGPVTDVCTTRRRPARRRSRRRPGAAGAVRAAIVPTVDLRRAGRDRPAGGPARALRPCASTSSRSSPTTSPRCGCRCWARRSSGASSGAACTTCANGPTTCIARVDDTPVRRRSRAWSCGPNRGGGRSTRSRDRPIAAAQPAAGRADARRAAVHPGDRRRTGRSSPGCCSPAAATRASTPGSPTTRPSGWRGRGQLGDYVLAGGEVAVLVIAEAVARLLPGVLGNAESAVDDSSQPARRAARGAGLHQAGIVARPGRPAQSCCPATTARSLGGGTSDRASAPRQRRPDLLTVL